MFYLQEAVTFFAQKIETDHVKKDRFRTNFFRDFRKLLGPNHVIKDLAKCDFGPIKAHLDQQRDEKKVDAPRRPADAGWLAGWLAGL